MLGTYALSSGYYDAYYGRAQRVRTKIADDFRAAFEKVDLIVTPDLADRRLRPRRAHRRPAGDVPVRLCTVPMPLAGIPAISIPGGLSEGLPVGIQLAGPAFSENRILDAAHALEQAIGFDGSAAAWLTSPTSRSSGSRSTSSSRRGRRCSAAASCRSARSRTRAPARSASAIPGALPVTNAEAVHFGLMIGMALGCEIAPRSIFHRKNYFYPDLPKGYQISQYDIPLARDGRLGDVRIHRAHLEEDAAKLVHAGASGRIHSAEASVVDFNRGGTPLVEIVTEPDLRSAAAGRRSGCACCAPRCASSASPT